MSRYVNAGQAASQACCGMDCQRVRVRGVMGSNPGD